MSLRKGSFVVGAVVALVLMTFVGPIQVGRRSLERQPYSARLDSAGVH